MVKHLCLEIIKQQQIPPLHRELVKAVTSSVKKEVRAYSKGQSRWRNMMEEEAKEFQSRTLVTHAIVTATSKVKLKPWCCRLFSIHGYLALILFTVTIPFQRQDVVNQNLEIRSTDIVFFVPVLWNQYSERFGRSWYMRLFHTPRTSFLLTTRLSKDNSCSGFIFIPGKNLRAPSRAVLNSSLRLRP